MVWCELRGESEGNRNQKENFEFRRLVSVLYASDLLWLISEFTPSIFGDEGVRW